jgi:hypothetical protein
MAKRKRQERVTPALLEYGFDTCPSDELSACCPYEYLASSELIQAAVERFRAGETDWLAKAVVLLFPINIAWAVFRGWWPRPYLDIPLTERRRNVLSPRQPKNLAHLVTPWTHLGDVNDARRVVAFYVPPGWPLSRLKKAFGDLLQRDYPELFREPAKPQSPIQNPGRGSLIEQYRTDLKALSAWRLQKQFGYAAEAAIALLKAHRLSTYQDVRSFRRGVKRASQKIAGLEQQLIQFAERRTA